MTPTCIFAVRFAHVLPQIECSKTIEIELLAIGE